MSSAHSVVNLCVLRLPLKSAGDNSLPFQPSALHASRVTSNDKKGLVSFFEELQGRRIAILNLLKQEDSSEEEVDAALKGYLSLLEHLLVPISDATPLNTAFSFAWRNVISSSNIVRVKTVEYEKVHVLLSCALWMSHRGSNELIHCDSGLSSAYAARAFQLYRKAIGMVECCQQLVEQITKSSNKMEHNDVDATVLAALKHLLCGEIQGITVLRAIEKGNAPSLITSLALDAQLQYEQCKEHSANSNLVGNQIGKIYAYASYKSLCYRSYALTYFAWVKLSASAGGAAVRLANEADAVFHNAEEQGPAYDRTYPHSSASERESFHRSLEQAVTKARKQAESDNRHVYYDKVPLDLPELPSPKQLIGAAQSMVDCLLQVYGCRLGSIAYAWPNADESVRREVFADLRTSATTSETVIEIVPGTGPKGTPQIDGMTQESAAATKTTEENRKPSQWWRWLLFIIAMPLLLLLTLVGIIVWILLIPLTIFCWPVGKLAHLTWRVVEYLIKAPLRAMLWASGREWKAIEHK